MQPRPVNYHWLRLRAVAHPTEDPERVAQALRFVAGGDVEISQTTLEMHHGMPQQVLEAMLTRSRALRDAFDRVLALPEAGRLLAEQERRTDDDGVFYVRLDKQAAYTGTLTIADNDDCVQLRLKVECHPATRPAAIEALRPILERRKA